ncbi:probable pathogenesis-related protein ARB_02861 [Astatotilapia calliptera]|uniref:probable pathogenesis-related protein ARB_02861 n=1 Tax=Astatotilapia calliptera TaxID=8154 RepID=UPI000E42B273|nr:probable pathogenesis-related protein ARB_02861 [Astatotilapia calliptera]
MFGREARYPSEIPKAYKVTEGMVTKLISNEDVCEGLKSQEVVYADVTKNVKTTQDKIRRGKAERGEEDGFQVGDMVLRKNVRQEQRKGGKLDADMLGPLRIVKLEGKSADLVSGKGKRTVKVNVDQLTHYFQPEERVPAKLKNLSPPPCQGPSAPPLSPPPCQGPSAPPLSPPPCQGPSAPPLSPPPCQGPALVQSRCDPENGE